MKYDLVKIMTRAWGIFRKAAAKAAITFSEALHRAWQAAKAEPINAQRIADAKASAGVDEETHTWADWRANGYEVRHGETALFGCDLIYASHGDGATYKARFFGASQVDALTA